MVVLLFLSSIVQCFSYVFETHLDTESPAKLKIYAELIKTRPGFNREMLRSFYFADEWAVFPHADEKQYILIYPGKEPMGIFDNKELKGDPKFHLTGSSFYPFVDNYKEYQKPPEKIIPGSCYTTRLMTDKKVSEWLNCHDQTPCQMHKFKMPVNAKILNPYVEYWYSAEKWKEKPACKIDVPFKVYIDYFETNQDPSQFYYLKPTNMTDTYASFSMQGKEYFLDIRGYSRDRNSKAEFLIDHWNNPRVYSDFEERWLLMKAPTIEKKHLKEFFEKIQSCGKKRDVSCLRSLSYTTRQAYEDDNNSDFITEPFKPIEWNEENIEEILECAKLDKSVAPPEYNIFLGKTKKCIFSNFEPYKIVLINEPEGFLLKHDFSEKIEIKD